MPRPSSGRKPITSRLGPAGLEKLDALCAEIGRPRSETIRLLLGRALVSPSVLREVRKESR